MAAVMIAVGFALFSNAQEAIRAEALASRELAKKFALAAIGSLISSHPAESIIPDLPVHLQRPRHVRITVFNHRGEPVEAAIEDNEDDRQNDTAPPPKWFYDLIRPAMEITRVPVMKDHRPLGYVVITSEPFDEIAEVWADYRALFLIMFLGCAATLTALFLALGRALKPLSVISRGLEQLEAGDYSVHLPSIPVPELDQIGVRLNALAEELDRTTQEKEELSHELITVQDNERKNIALELHDEFGPCLFGIKVDASYIETEAKALGQDKGDEIAERAGAILKIVDHMQAHNRALLYRLRPMAIGHFGLPKLLGQLIKEFSNRYRETNWSFDVSDTLTSGGETFDLTIYRMVQECLTNAARHADASNVAVEVALIPIAQEERTPKKELSPFLVVVTVDDDGCGFPKENRPGMGLSGMNQRVKALGGKFSISSSEGSGTSVSARIPFTPQETLCSETKVRSETEQQIGALPQ